MVLALHTLHKQPCMYVRHPSLHVFQTRPICDFAGAHYVWFAVVCARMYLCCRRTRQSMALASHVCLLQIENFDQTISTALEDWDDHEDLTHYDFNTDGVQAPDNDDDKRKLAYRYASSLSAASLHLFSSMLLVLLLVPQVSSASYAPFVFMKCLAEAGPGQYMIHAYKPSSSQFAFLCAIQPATLLPAM